MQLLNPVRYVTRSRGAALVATGALAISACLVATVGQAVAQHNRLISVGGAVTEVVYALEQEDRLIAVDSTSLYPPEAQDLPGVGYLRQLSAEPLLALDPDLLLADADAGPPETIRQLKDAGLPVIRFDNEDSPDGVITRVRAIAETLGVSAAGEELVARLEREFAAAQDHVAKQTATPSVLFLLSVGNGAPLAGGRGTSAHAMIGLAGGRNAAADFEGYKPLSPEAAAALAPDVLLLDSRSLQALGGRDALLRRPEVAVTPAAQAGRIIDMDGLLLLGFGPRTPQAIRQLAEALHTASEPEAQ